MKRAALERPLMERRQRVDVNKHWPDTCECTPGRWRKRRPTGCPAGRHCSVCFSRHPNTRSSALERELRKAKWPEL